MDCGYLLEARRFGLVPAVCVLEENKRKIKIFQHNIVIFAAEKNRSTLHGRVFVMMTS